MVPIRAGLPSSSPSSTSTVTTSLVVVLPLVSNWTAASAALTIALSPVTLHTPVAGV